MRLRLFAASLAAALAVALCAVPAFASESETVVYSSDYGTATVRIWSASTIPTGVAAGIYRTEDGLSLVSILPDGTPPSSATNWEFSSDGVSWASLDISATVGTITASEIGQYRRSLVIAFPDQSQTTLSMTFNVTSLGSVGNDTVGLFGITTESIDSTLDWFGAYLSGIVENPVLLFFCLGLPLLTIGITIIRRLLATRA